MIVASFLLASWLGCCTVALPWSDRFGRRIWIMAGASIQVIGTIISASASSPGQLIAGRVLIVRLFFFNSIYILINSFAGYRQWFRSIHGSSICS